MAEMRQGSHFFRSSIEEACAGLFGVKAARDNGMLNLIVDGDCLPLMNKLWCKVAEDNALGLLLVIFYLL